jgi:acyl-CoA thioester hydrolase
VLKKTEFIPALHLAPMGHFQATESGKVHVHDLRVRYADTDRMDMVYHGTYAAYLEAARVEMLRDAGFVYAKMEQEGTLLPVVQLDLTYKQPARYDELLEVHTHITLPPTSKLELHCEVRRGEDLLVVGRVVLVFVDGNSGRPKRAPEKLAQAMSAMGLVWS